MGVTCTSALLHYRKWRVIRKCHKYYNFGERKMHQSSKNFAHIFCAHVISIETEGVCWVHFLLKDTSTTTFSTTYIYFFYPTCVYPNPKEKYSTWKSFYFQSVAENPKLMLNQLAFGFVEPHGYLMEPLARTSIHLDPNQPYNPPYWYDNK